MDVRKLLDLAQIRPLDQDQEVAVLLVRVGVEADPAVQCRLDRGNLDVPSDPGDGRAAGQSVHQIEVRRAGDVHDLEQGEVDVLALARATRAQRRCDGRHRSEGATDELGRAPSPAMIGSCSGRPRPAMEPHSAWIVNSVAGRCVYGPPRPKAEIESSTRPGNRVHSSSSSITPGAKLSTTRSASSTNARTSASRGLAYHRPLRGVQKLKERPILVLQIGSRGGPAPQWIALGRLHFDDIRSGIGQQLRGVSTGDTRREIDDAQIAKAVHEVVASLLRLTRRIIADQGVGRPPKPGSS